jgi:YgiT-type zinc finger domain-containing protein
MVIPDSEQCPICGKGILEESSEDIEFSYKGHNKTVADCIIETCSYCKEEIISKSSLFKLCKILTLFKQEIDQEV